MGVRTIIAVAGLGLVAGCSGHPAEAQRPEAGRAPAAPAAPAAAPRALGLELAEGMTLREKVGQLFVPTVAGTADGVAAQKRYHVGGFIYFPGNLRTPRETAALSNALQAAARIPLLIGVDEETGPVSRARFTTRFPGAMALGAAGSAPLTRRAAAVTGSELRAVGINLDFAPVADVNSDPANPVIGTRSFGSDPRRVAALLKPSIEGFHDAGVAAVVKHFPGHGDTGTDSHTGLPVIGHSTARWEAQDAPPFRAAIAAGVDAVMTAHISVPGLDPSGVPATMSKRVLTGLLRQKLGYDGVIITDSLQMAGARVRGGAPEAAVRAIAAGADQILMPPDLGSAYDAVLGAVRDGRIPAARLDEAVRHVLTLKERRGLFGVSAAAPGAAVSTPEHRGTALDVATASVTVVRAAGGVLPLKGGVHVAGASRVAVSAALRREGVRVISPARARTFVVVITKAGPVTARYLRGLAERRKVVVVALGDPYLLRYTAPAQASVAVYSPQMIALRGLARVLSGRAAPAGRLPVAVPHGPALGTGAATF
ncbi:glycoside hydrolase family 3 protein [Actinocorallia longicatena]|uniref:beta-N-acetylhexosaminidase n=1 Tax=Actinocorallia longicatena TaxID=111803 RepID=A0ABP6QJA9_9ACTN